MNKKKEILFNLNNFLLALSVVLDKAEHNINNTSNNHIKRVAYLSLKIGQKFNLSNEQLSDLCAYALSHSNALYETKDNIKAYCIQAEANISHMPFLTNEENVLKYHKEHVDGSGPFGLSREQIPLFSQIIGFSDLIDTKFDLSDPSIENRTRICEYIKANEEKLFSLDMSEIFCEELAIDTYFWLDLQFEQQILAYIFKTVHDYSKPLSFEQIQLITLPYFKMIDNNSKLLEYVSVMAEFYELEHKDTHTLIIAASLCKIGKLALNPSYKRQASLNNNEYEMMKSYVYYSKMVLDNIMGFTDISSWASKVQERVNGSGYPYSLEAKDLSFKDRLLSSLVVYDALKNKSYNSTLSHEEAIKIMNEMADLEQLDKAMIENFSTVLN